MQNNHYKKGDIVNWYLGLVSIVDIVQVAEKTFYDLEQIDCKLSCRVSEKLLVDYQKSNFDKRINKHTPHILIVDNFYKDPMSVREIATQQIYYSNDKAFKGQRSVCRFLLPNMKEEFERLLGLRIKNWLSYPTNGIFQITSYTDPLVYHSDLQNYAAAIYLTPNAPVNAGTSFWRDRIYGCRRPPFHPLEKDRFTDDKERQETQNNIYNDYNFIHNENWELVDRVGSIFNRLVIWDAQLIHSATSYEHFKNSLHDVDNSRLVQLFFFDVER